MKPYLAFGVAFAVVCGLLLGLQKLGSEEPMRPSSYSCGANGCIIRGSK